MSNTLADVFHANGLSTWWTAPDTQDFNGKSEFGTDYAVAPTSPVGAIQGGKVVYAQEAPGHPGSSLGNIVIVETADGQAWEYLHLRKLNVKEGDYVQPGDVVGLSGGCPANGYQQGGGCSYTDQFSTGPHIEVRHADAYNPSGAPWTMNWTNPKSLIDSLGGGVPLGGVGQSLLPSGVGFQAGPWVELLIRAGIIIAGVAFIAIAVFVFMQGNHTVQNIETGIGQRTQQAATVAAEAG